MFVAVREDAGETLNGLRMSAEDFLALPESKEHYELVDGVVLMPPSPTLLHQAIVAELVFQMKSFLVRSEIGQVYPDVDVHLGAGPGGREIVYRPDLVFVSADRIGEARDRLRSLPSLVVEVVSPATRAFDWNTKKADYEQAGVQEYWVVDPGKHAVVMFRLSQGRYAETSVTGEVFASHALPGFELNLARLHALFANG